MPRIEAICVSEAKGQRKLPVESASFRSGHGIEGDAHAGPWHRQVSLLSAEDIAAARQGGLPDLKPGDFAENAILSGLDLNSFGLGTRIRLGRSAELSITQIGKVCHAPCQIYALTGDCIMPRRGLFARVVADGEVRVGDAAEVIRPVGRDVFQVVLLTISDRCSRGEARDTAGPAVSEAISRSLPVHLYRTEIIPDDQPVIVGRLKHYCDGHSIDMVVTIGGTGFSRRDVTPEASRAVIERFTPGLDEAMRAESMGKTPRGALSRAVSGIRGSTLIVNLPGSERSSVENIAAILPALEHGLGKLRGDPSDCGRSRALGPGDGATDAR